MRAFRGVETFGPGTWARKLYEHGYPYDRDKMNSPVHPSGKPPASAYAPPCPKDMLGGKGWEYERTMNGKYYRRPGDTTTDESWTEIVEIVLRREFDGWDWRTEK